MRRMYFAWKGLNSSEEHARISDRGVSDDGLSKLEHCLPYSEGSVGPVGEVR